jgi:hypothetical protein
LPTQSDLIAEMTAYIRPTTQTSPARTLEADARRAIVEGAGFRIPARSMAGAHQNRVARRDRLFVDALAFEARLEVGEGDLLADVEDPALQAVEQDAAGEGRPSVFNSEFLEPVRRPRF